jgi:hypothetical protein
VPHSSTQSAPFEYSGLPCAPQQAMGRATRAGTSTRRGRRPKASTARSRSRARTASPRRSAVCVFPDRPPLSSIFIHSDAHAVRRGHGGVAPSTERKHLRRGAAAELRVVAVAPLRSDDSLKSWRRFRAPLFRCLHTCMQTCTHACMHTMHTMHTVHTDTCMPVCILTEKRMSSTLLRFASPATQPGSAAAPVRRLHRHVHAVHPANLVGRRRQLHVRGQARPSPCVRAPTCVSTRTSGCTLRPIPPRWGNPAATAVAGRHGCAHAWWSWC